MHLGSVSTANIAIPSQKSMLTIKPAFVIGIVNGNSYNEKDVPIGLSRKSQDKRRRKRKAKKKKMRVAETAAVRSEKLDYLIWELEYASSYDQFDLALSCAKKALRLAPKHVNLWRHLGYIGRQLERLDVELEACDGLYALGKLELADLMSYCDMLFRSRRYSETMAVAEEALSKISRSRSRNKRESKLFFEALHSTAKKALKVGSRTEKAPAASKRLKKTDTTQKDPRPANTPRQEQSPSKALPDIPVSIHIDTEPFIQAWQRGISATQEQYELSLDAYHIRLNQTFDQLVCLGSLKDVHSLWYQEETARKVLKHFRGRALLADEVGLGKTIEALIVFSEYYRRGMIENGLILTPTPLVSQWRDELKSKFDLEIPCTDDSDYRRKGDQFWQAPFILASINQAKTRKNFKTVTEREYDIVIVDEAHHLKNRNTLNWKLVNALKKKYLLMLTATPVENNLMELYNLITLLKPGQLKTASAFRQEFMTRGDPTDPQNREKLKDLLNAVMIRNTRALANINIPPRFAQTIRVQATRTEQELYQRITELVRRMNADGGSHQKLLLKHLLAEAGSSPQAVSLTLNNLLVKRDMPPDREKEIRAINNLCRSMDFTQKNRMLFKLIKSNPGKIIIFVKYLGTLDSLVQFLDWERIPHALFHGGMQNIEKDQQIERFRDDVDVLLTTEIGGEGRNLQFCHQMVNYDLPWNPMKIEQRIGRIHRFGQEKEVMIFNLCNGGSIEEYILDILDKKVNMFEMVIGEIDMILGRIRGEQDFSDRVYDIWVNAETQEDRSTAFNHLGSHLKRSKTGYQKTKKLDDALFGENYEL